MKMFHNTMAYLTPKIDSKIVLIFKLMINAVQFAEKFMEIKISKLNSQLSVIFVKRRG